MLSVLKKELNSFFSSLIAYIVIIVFLAATGLFTWVYPETNILNFGFASLDTLFMIGPWVFLFLIPAITMRTFAEEKRTGTMELLLTRPLTDVQLILGKYFASLILIIFAILPTLIYYISVYNLGSPMGNIDSAGVFGSYFGLIGLASVFCAIGIFASSVTDNQIVSFILAVFLCYLLYAGFTSLSALNVWSSSAVIISKLGIDYHYTTMSKGLVDSRDVLYFVSVVLVMLLGTKMVLGSRKW